MTQHEMLRLLEDHIMSNYEYYVKLAKEIEQSSREASIRIEPIFKDDIERQCLNLIRYRYISNMCLYTGLPADIINEYVTGLNIKEIISAI